MMVKFYKNFFCDSCGKREKKKHLNKIRGRFYCKNCAIEIRKNHRKETIKRAGIQEELKKLDNKIHSTYKTSKKEVKALQNPQKLIQKPSKTRTPKEITKPYIPTRYRLKANEKIIEPPMIKGSTLQKSNNSNCYLTLTESQFLLRKFMSRGAYFDEAKEKVNKVRDALKETRLKLKEQNKSDEEIKISKEKLLEELWSH